jgi:fermentation-respiration switch protein FrsA (DUF1100 family)
MPEIPRWLGYPLILLAAWGFFVFLAARSTYYPMRHPQGDWSVKDQLGARDVWFEAGDGVRLHAWWIEAPQSTLATLFFHGNAGNITHRAFHAREILAAGSSLLLLDYRGYGRSEGYPTERGLYRDAEAAWKWLLSNGYAPESVILHGESLGTAVAVELAARTHPAGVVLEAPLSSARDVAASVLPMIGPFVVWGFDSMSRIPRVNAPKLFIHGARDSIIPIRLGERLFAAAPDPKDFWRVPAADHNDILDAAGPGYRQRLAGFYASLARPRR